MEVTIADHSGFCFGVERAIKLTYDELEKTLASNIVTYGPIIHNPHVVKELEDLGIRQVHSTDDICSNEHVVVRSHGVPQHEFDEIARRSEQIVNATCPFVEKAQKVAKELSNECDFIVILGEENHPEMQSVLSYITKPYAVIATPDEIVRLPHHNSYGYMAQTTQNEADFLRGEELLQQKCSKLYSRKTICSATENRQREAIALAEKVDIMVVIGGKNSANTTKLYNLCKEICTHSFHIESPEELDLSVFREGCKVGITAGASTPLSLVKKVHDYIIEGNHGE